jgi:hypothetical protein
MQHPHKSFHPTPLRVEREQTFFGIWKHTNVFPIENGGAGEWHGIGRPSLPRGDLASTDAVTALMLDLLQA